MTWRLRDLLQFRAEPYGANFRPSAAGPSLPVIRRHRAAHTDKEEKSKAAAGLAEEIAREQKTVIAWELRKKRIWKLLFC